MTSAIFDSERALFVDSINKSICFVNAARPMSREFMLEQFGLAESFVDAVTFNALQQTIDFLQRLAVLRLPIKILLKNFVREDFVH